MTEHPRRESDAEPQSGGWQLAQVNIAVANGPTDSAIMAEFMGALDAINRAADNAPGFVWRLQEENGNLTDVRVFDEPDMLINLSVWDSVESFKAYTYGTAHGPYVKRRQEWFTKPDGLPVLAMWWVRSGEFPTAMEGRRRLELMAEVGPNPDAFNFAKRFAPPTS